MLGVCALRKDAVSTYVSPLLDYTLFKERHGLLSLLQLPLPTIRMKNT